MPYENCKDIRFCECEDDVPEVYKLSWSMSKVCVKDLVPMTPSGIIVVEDSKKRFTLLGMSECL